MWVWKVTKYTQFWKHLTWLFKLGCKLATTKQWKMQIQSVETLKTWLVDVCCVLFWSSAPDFRLFQEQHPNPGPILLPRWRCQQTHRSPISLCEVLLKADIFARMMAMIGSAHNECHFFRQLQSTLSFQSLGCSSLMSGDMSVFSLRQQHRDHKCVWSPEVCFSMFSLPTCRPYLKRVSSTGHLCKNKRVGSNRWLLPQPEEAHACSLLFHPDPPVNL